MARAETGGRRPAGRALPALAALLGLWLCACSLPAAALEHERPLADFTLERWDSRQGLPHNMVLALAQTPDGYLWAGTWEGLARWNGTEFAVFDRSNTPEMRGNGVRALAVSRDGALWVGTARAGLLRRRAGRWERWGRDTGFPFDEIIALHEDSRGALWVVGEEAGVARMDAAGVTLFDVARGVGHATVYTVAEGPDGAIHFGHGAGIDRIEGERAVPWGASRGLPMAPVRAIHFDPLGSVAVSSGWELWSLEPGGRFARDARQDRGLGELGVVARDRDVSLWTGSVDTGIWRLRGETVERIDATLGLPQNRVAAWLQDQEGSVWIGTSAGLARLKDLPFTSIGMRRGLSDEYVRAILPTAKGAWLATSHGLNLIDGQGTRHWTRADGLPSDSVLALDEAPDGSLWIGTYGAGATRLIDGRVRPVAGLQTLGDRQVRAVLARDDGSVWFGTNAELARWQDGSLTRYTTRDGLPRNYVMALAEGADGRLWIGTSNGLARWDGERFERFDPEHGFPARDVFSIHVQIDGTLWLGTGEGLVRVREDRFALVDTERGLPHNSVFQVLDDGLGHLWMCSNKGAFRVPRAQLERAADEPGFRIEPMVFGRLDGMGDTQCNGGSQPAAARGPDGRLWFATAAGASVVDPSRRFDLPDPPASVAIERVRIDGVEAPAASRVQLPAGPHKIELHYAGLSLRIPERVRYRHRLLGFDPDWIDAGASRLAVYSNLAPGDYRFEVEASSGGPWSGRLVALQIGVVPQYWQTTGFRFASIGALALLFWAIFRWRVGQARANERRLALLVEMRTRDLADQTERLSSADKEKSQLLEALRQQAQALARLASEDALTGLPNRRAFDERLALAFERGRREGTPMAVALADIDHFKQINDNWSHAVGDAVLRVLADVLRRHVSAEVHVARYGGEEFALLFTGQASGEAVARCEALRREVEMLDLSTVAPGLTVRLSIGAVHDDGRHPHHEKLLSAADEQLYAAKRAGRNRVVG